MHRKKLLGILIVTTLLNNGCGTVVNLVRRNNEPKAYGGVRADLELFASIMDGEPNPHGPLSTSGNGGGSLAAIVIILAPLIDVPLSFIGDTLTYPLARRMDKRRIAEGPVVVPPLCQSGERPRYAPRINP